MPRKEKAKASEATLGIPLGIPLGADTQRRHSCGSHTVSTRQTLLRLVWPCQPGLFASRLPTRFSTAIAVLIIEFGLGFTNNGPLFFSLATPSLKQCFLRLQRTPVANINDNIKKLALSECCIMLHPNANALIIAADSWARVKALPARKRRSTVL